MEKALGRDSGTISAVTGYAGGQKGSGISCFWLLEVPAVLTQNLPYVT